MPVSHIIAGLRVVGFVMFFGVTMGVSFCQLVKLTDYLKLSDGIAFAVVMAGVSMVFLWLFVFGLSLAFEGVPQEAIWKMEAPGQ